jgi:hypothetical protein
MEIDLLKNGARLGRTEIGANYSIVSGRSPLHRVRIPTHEAGLRSAVLWMSPQIGSNRAVTELAIRRPDVQSREDRSLLPSMKFSNRLTFLSFADPNQKSLWWLRLRKPFDNGYWLYETYFFSHALLGWALIAIVIAAISALIRNE